MMDRRIFLTTVAGLLAAPLAAKAQQAGAPGGASSLPPATPIQDLKGLVGKWKGGFTSRGILGEPWDWTVNADGSYDIEVVGETGTLEIREGKVRSKNLTTGRTSTTTLHEGGGRRVLRGVTDDGQFTWELTPAAIGSLPTERPRPAIRIGILTSHLVGAAFRQALEELGYVDGQTIALEYRRGSPERLPGFAADLVRLNVNALVASATAPALAAKRATSTIPIVFISADPLTAGLVPSLARPGANLTGVSAVSTDVTAKRLQLLKEAVPGAGRVGILVNPTHPAATAQLRELDAAARASKVQLRTFEIRAPGDVKPAFVAMEKEAIGAVVVLVGPVLLLHGADIVRLAAKHRLPLIGESRQYAVDGGLMSYGTSYGDLVRQAVRYVDKILKGAKPGDLPVEQPMKFELVINLKTAKALGLTIPPSVLGRADEVIE